MQPWFKRHCLTLLLSKDNGQYMQLSTVISYNTEWWISKKGYPSIEKFSFENSFFKTIITRIIKEEISPRAEVIYKIAMALEITPNDLMLVPAKKPSNWGKPIFKNLKR